MAPSGLQRAHDLQAEAAGIGFDWLKPEDMLDKVEEELSELRAAVQSGAAVAAGEELGDLLFVLVNLARRLRLETDAVLHQACDKFERRFAHVRAGLEQQGVRPQEGNLATMEALWEDAKRRERSNKR